VAHVVFVDHSVVVVCLEHLYKLLVRECGRCSLTACKLLIFRGWEAGHGWMDRLRDKNPANSHLRVRREWSGEMGIVIVVL
jgi:hypothetical protein